MGKTFVNPGSFECFSWMMIFRANIDYVRNHQPLIIIFLFQKFWPRDCFVGVFAVTQLRFLQGILEGVALYFGAAFAMDLQEGTSRDEMSSLRTQALSVIDPTIQHRLKNSNTFRENPACWQQEQSVGVFI